MAHRSNDLAFEGKRLRSAGLVWSHVRPGAGAGRIVRTEGVTAVAYSGSATTVAGAGASAGGVLAATGFNLVVVAAAAVGLLIIGSLLVLRTAASRSGDRRAARSAVGRRPARHRRLARHARAHA